MDPFSDKSCTPHTTGTWSGDDHWTLFWPLYPINCSHRCFSILLRKKAETGCWLVTPKSFYNHPPAKPNVHASHFKIHNYHVFQEQLQCLSGIFIPKVTLRFLNYPEKALFFDVSFKLGSSYSKSRKVQFSQSISELDSWN